MDVSLVLFVAEYLEATVIIFILLQRFPDPGWCWPVAAHTIIMNNHVVTLQTAGNLHHFLGQTRVGFFSLDIDTTLTTLTTSI